MGFNGPSKKEFDVEVKKDKELTGEIKRSEVIIGYYPKFHQAVRRMYELMIADDLKVGGGDKIIEAIGRASDIYDKLTELGVKVDSGENIKLN